MKRIIHWLLMVSILLGATGCSPSMVSRRTSPNAVPHNARVAVLPFENFSGAERTGQKLTEYFQTLLTGEPNLETVEFATVNEALRRHRIRSANLISREQIDTLAQELGIQYFLTGTLLEYRELTNSYLGNVPQISFNSRLVSCATRQPVWVGVSNKSGDKGEIVFGIGAVRSPDELMRKMAQDVVSQIVRLVGK